MDFEAIRLEISDGIAALVLANGDRGNPIDGRLCRELCEAAGMLSDRSDVRAVLISAEGPSFSFGGDIGEFLAAPDRLPATIKHWTSGLHSAIARLQRMDAPVVVAVHGNCAGGMAAFVAGADILVAATDARFVSAYASIGFSCDAGASVMLSRRMGLARARRYLLLNETIAADEALACGLVDRVVEREALHGHAAAITRTLSQGPTRAFGAMRRLLLSAGNESLETQLELEAQALSLIVGTADASEGLAAFTQKRLPNFRGA